MTWWVLTEACSQLKKWHARYPQAAGLSVGINLSGKTFSHPQLVPRIAEIIKETGIDPTLLKIEITESALMKNAQSTTATINQLKEMNVELLIDDFGTGYSSLAYLHRWPIDVLKIDRSF